MLGLSSGWMFSDCSWCAQGQYVVTGIKPGSVMCKATSYSLFFISPPRNCFFFFLTRTSFFCCFFFLNKFVLKQFSRYLFCFFLFWNILSMHVSNMDMILYRAVQSSCFKKYEISL